MAARQKTRRQGVVTAGQGASVSPLFLAAVGTFAVAVLVFVAFALGAACGGDSDGGPGPIVSAGTPRPTATRTPPPEATATRTPATGASATAPAGATTSPSTPAPPTPGPGQPTQAPPASTAKVVTCGDILAPLDKDHRLAETCRPPLESLPAEIANGNQSLRPEARTAMVEMLGAAQRDGLSMAVVSSFRSYQEQYDLFNYYVRTIGQAEAERTSAHAGHSEHQLGTTADVSAASVGFDLLESFGATAEGKWLAANGWKFGFIVSYPAGKEAITGYAYEPWHVRFVGKAEAAKVFNSGLTLHEYLLRR